MSTNPNHARILELKEMSLERHCAMFDESFMPGNGEQAEYYSEMAAVLAWKFLKPTTPFTLADVLEQRKVIMHALMGPGLDESHLSARVVASLVNARSSFAGRLRQLARSVVDRHNRPMGADDTMLDFATQFERLSTTEHAGINVMELNIRLVWGFRNAFEALVAWGKFPTMDEAFRRQLLLSLITNYIPLAYSDHRMGIVSATERLELFKDLLSAITDRTITDEHVERLYRESNVDNE